MSNERYKNLGLALSTWLQGGATLVSLTGHTSTTPRIMGTSDEKPPNTSLIVENIFTVPLDPDVDCGPFLSVIRVHCRGNTKALSLQLAGALQDHVKQDPTTGADASFTSSGVRSLGVQWRGIPEIHGKQEADSGGFVTEAEIEIQWIET